MLRLKWRRSDTFFLVTSARSKHFFQARLLPALASGARAQPGVGDVDVSAAAASASSPSLILPSADAACASEAICHGPRCAIPVPDISPHASGVAIVKMIFPWDPRENKLREDKGFARGRAARE